MKKTIRFGVIGCGLMGREFAGAAARWSQLASGIAKPEIVGVADPNPAARDWFRDNFPAVRISSEGMEQESFLFSREARG